MPYKSPIVINPGLHVAGPFYILHVPSCPAIVSGLTSHLEIAKVWTLPTYMHKKSILEILPGTIKSNPVHFGTAQLES